MRIWQGRQNTCASALVSGFVHSLQRKQRKRAENPVTTKSIAKPGPRCPFSGTVFPRYLLLLRQLVLTFPLLGESQMQTQASSCSGVRRVLRRRGHRTTRQMSVQGSPLLTVEGQAVRTDGGFCSPISSPDCNWWSRVLFWESL